MKKKVLVDMSGGVDSSVAAAVLMEEYEVTGATMKLFTNDDIQLDSQKTCCSLDASWNITRKSIRILKYQISRKDNLRWM